ncbi:MAG: hypothetical protein [Bacteriophage sp.]|nr:MAG: hypothetical protein [Bacteriophage sp.]
MDNPKNEEIMEQNKKEVVFDGKDLIFNVDDIEVKNGKLPDSFNIKERYEISAESLSMLVVALSDGNTMAKLIDDFPRKSRTIYPMKDEYVKKLVEEVSKLESEVKSLQEKVYKERERVSDERYKRHMLGKLIKEHNKRSWWGRTERIELEMEE